MINSELQTPVRELTQQATAKANEYSGLLGTAKAFIIQHFGENGLIAAYVAVAVVVLYLGSRAAKSTYSMVKYLFVPSVGLAVLGSFVSPYSFYALLPVTATACALLLLIKG